MYQTKSPKTLLICVRKNLKKIISCIFAGFFQTPFWDGVTRYLPPDVDEDDELTVPDGHSVMVSFQQIGTGTEAEFCIPDNAAIIRIPDQPSNSHTYCFDTKHTLPLFFVNVSTVNITFQFSFIQSQIYTGFRLRFSFHENPARINFLKDTNQFDCSGRYWPQFRPHFPCNLKRDCVGGEDEAECPYMSIETCGQDYLAVSGSCFILDRNSTVRSWSEASLSCSNSNQHLPALNTREEWEDFQRLLDYQKGIIPFIGLSFGLSRLPNMYVLHVCV